MTEIKPQRRWARSARVKERYGGVSDMWLWRRRKNDPRFPKPITIGKSRFWDEDELDAYDAELRKEANATT